MKVLNGKSFSISNLQEFSIKHTVSYRTLLSFFKTEIYILELSFLIIKGGGASAFMLLSPLYHIVSTPLTTLVKIKGFLLLFVRRNKCW
jgi:hypothetical protein